MLESSKRWWKCRNRFNEVGFVPSNILEPIAHIDPLDGGQGPPKVGPHTRTRTHARTHRRLCVHTNSQIHTENIIEGITQDSNQGCTQ